MDGRRAAGALLALAACVVCAHAAPTASNQTSLDLYNEAGEGCYYNFQHYGEGDRIMTNEPCLNCTCHNRMLMCYLRVCPFTKPIGQDCTVEKRADQCCPIVTCPDVPVDLLTSTSTTSPDEYGGSSVGKLDKYGCSINNKYFPEGSKVPPTPGKPCEHCYCIRNMTTCVMQECTLHVDGCTPIYHKDVCCPVRYSCDHPEDELLALDDMTTTVRPTPGFLLTTTTIAPVTQMSQECVHDNQIFPDGALIKTEKACEHCYCMKGDIVCVVQECGTPMENEGKNCTSMAPREGQCCPDTYICEGDEPTDVTESVTESQFDEITTSSPPRRVIEGSGYRHEPGEPIPSDVYLPPVEEGSGEEQITEKIPSVDDKQIITEKSPVKEDTTTEKEDDIAQLTTGLNKLEKSTEEPDHGENTVPSEIFNEKSTEPAYVDKVTDNIVEKVTDALDQTDEHSTSTVDITTSSPERTVTSDITITTETLVKLDDEKTTIGEKVTYIYVPEPTTESVSIIEKSTESHDADSLVTIAQTTVEETQTDRVDSYTANVSDKQESTTILIEKLDTVPSLIQDIDSTRKQSAEEEQTEKLYNLAPTTHRPNEEIQTKGIEAPATTEQSEEETSITEKTVTLGEKSEDTTLPTTQLSDVAQTEKSDLPVEIHNVVPLQHDEVTTEKSIDILTDKFGETSQKPEIVSQQPIDENVTVKPEDILSKDDQTMKYPSSEYQTEKTDVYLTEQEKTTPITVSESTDVTEKSEIDEESSFTPQQSSQSFTSPEPTTQAPKEAEIDKAIIPLKHDEVTPSAEPVKIQTSKPVVSLEEQEIISETTLLPDAYETQKIDTTTASILKLQDEPTTTRPVEKINIDEQVTESVISDTEKQESDTIPSTTEKQFETTSFNPIENEIDEEVPILSPGRIPGEGDCLLNGVTYGNESNVPSTTKCHSNCKCISSIVKCDPIMCPPPPAHMDNCESMFDSPDACCPTYICDQAKETVPPESHSYVHGTEVTPSTHKIECQGDQCEISIKIDETTPEKPTSECTSDNCESIDKVGECGPEGCVPSPLPSPSGSTDNLPVKCSGDQCQPLPSDCTGNECSSPSLDCVGKECAQIPITDSESQACANPDDCKQPTKPSCEGEHCKDIGTECIGNECTQTPVDESKVCSGLSCEQSTEDQVPTKCNEESCRREQVPIVQIKPVSECTDSQCLQTTNIPDMHKPVSTPESTLFESVTERDYKAPDTKTVSPDDVTEIYDKLITTSKLPHTDITETEVYTKKPEDTSIEVSTPEKSETQTTEKSDKLPEIVPIEASTETTSDSATSDLPTTMSEMFENTRRKTTFISTEPSVEEKTTDKSSLSQTTKILPSDKTVEEEDVTQKYEDHGVSKTTTQSAIITESVTVATTYIKPELIETSTAKDENIEITTLEPKKTEATTKSDLVESETENTPLSSHVEPENIDTTEQTIHIRPESSAATDIVSQSPEPETTETYKIKEQTPAIEDLPKLTTVSGQELATELQKADATTESQKADESTEREKADESTEPQKGDESTEPQKTDESTELQKADESTEPQKADESTEPQKADESTEPQTTDESTEPQKADESTEPQKTDKSTESQKADESSEPQKADESTEPQKADESTEPQKADESLEPQKVDESTKPQKTDESSEPQKADESTKPQKTDESTEPQTADESTEPQKAEESTKPQKVDESTEPQKTGESTEPQKVDDSTKPQKADESTEPQKADESTKPQKADDSTDTQKADESTEPQKAEVSTELQKVDETTESEKADQITESEKTDETSESSIITDQPDAQEADIESVSLTTDRTDSTPPSSLVTSVPIFEVETKSTTETIPEEKVTSQSETTELDSATTKATIAEEKYSTELEVTDKISESSSTETPGVSIKQEISQSDNIPEQATESETISDKQEEERQSTTTIAAQVNTEILETMTESTVSIKPGEAESEPTSDKQEEERQTTTTTAAQAITETLETMIESNVPDKIPDKSGEVGLEPTVAVSEDVTNKPISSTDIEQKSESPTNVYQEAESDELPEKSTEKESESPVTESQKSTEQLDTITTVSVEKQTVTEINEIPILPFEQEDKSSTEKPFVSEEPISIETESEKLAETTSNVATNIPEDVTTTYAEAEDKTTQHPVAGLETETKLPISEEEPLVPETQTSKTTTLSDISVKISTEPIPVDEISTIENISHDKKEELSTESPLQQESTDRSQEESTTKQNITAETESPSTDSTISLSFKPDTATDVPQSLITEKIQSDKESTSTSEVEKENVTGSAEQENITPQYVEKETPIVEKTGAEGETSVDSTTEHVAPVTQSKEKLPEVVNTEAPIVPARTTLADIVPVEPVSSVEDTEKIHEENVTPAPTKDLPTTQREEYDTETHKIDTTPKVTEQEIIDEKELTTKLPEIIQVTSESLPETTPYFVELEEHTHKFIDEISSTVGYDEAITTVQPEIEEIKPEISTEKDEILAEPSSIKTPVVEKEQEKITKPTQQFEETSTLPTVIMQEEEKSEKPVEETINETTPSPLASEQPSTETTDKEAEKPSIPDSTEKELISTSTDKPIDTADTTDEPAKTTSPKLEDEISTPAPSEVSQDKLTKPSETATPAPELPKPVPGEMQSTEEEEEEVPPSGSTGYGQEPDYVEEDQAFGPGTCRYGGKVYVSAQQIPRDDPCDFCFCFRSDIICLQQSCPPPIHGCHEEPIQGFCCPRYECPVAMATSLNVTTTTTTTTTTLPPHFLPHAYKGAAQRKGCQIKGHTYKVGDVVRASSGPCLHCTCGGDGQMKCDPKVCTPEPMLRQMIAAAVSAKRRR